MKVSRDYINYEQLLDFPVTERFLKLPVTNFFEKVENITLLAPQIAMVNALNDPRHRFVVACLSRRTGKTYAANHLAFLKALEPGSKVLIISPNYSLSNISWNEQIQLLNKHNVEIDKCNAKDKEIVLRNGSMIKFGSISQANSCVGRSYDLILFDEAALDPKGIDAFNVQLRPTLDKINSKAIFISTPRGTNYFHEFYMRGFDPKFPRWASIHSTWEDNPRLSLEDIDEARRSMSRAEFQQEYEADFTTFEGQVYEGFDFVNDIQDLSEMDFSDSNRYETLMGIDPGYKDATGALVLKFDTELDHFYLIWDYEKAERTTEQHAEEFGTIIEQLDVDLVFIDSAAAQFRQDLATMYDIPSNKANKSLLDGIAYVQTIVENHKLTVDIGCTAALDMLRNYRWDNRDNLITVKPVHDKFSHIADALRYALYSYVR